MFSGLFIYFINRPATYFPCLLFQTRYGTNCFARRAGEGGPGSVLITVHTRGVFLMTNYKARYMPRDTVYIRLF